MERGRGNHGDVGFVMTPTILSAGAAVAALTYRLLSGNQVETAEREDRRPCGKCGGTGYVECFCTRWDYSAASGVERKFSFSLLGILSKVQRLCDIDD